MSNNIGFINDCYGCGVCATVCGRKIIEIGLNKDGFYEPHITDESKCTNCGICSETCAYIYENLSLKNTEIHSYAAWSKDKIVRAKCSSGGVGFEVGKYLLSQGFKACVVKYNASQNRAEHYIASTVEELQPSIGSKYIQSYTVDAFKAINRKEKYFVTGTPCQMDSFRRYIQRFHCEDNFILLDFFCHGVPSKIMWNKYLEASEQKIGKVTNVTWRNKFTGWHDSWAMHLIGKKKEQKSWWTKGDEFYGLFLSDSCLSKACYDKCKYKMGQSSADIRIGDLWGHKYKNNKEGVSGVLSLTPKGEQVLHKCNIQLIDEQFEIVTEFQMNKCADRPYYFDKVFNALHNSKLSIYDAYKYIKIDLFKKKWKRRFHKIIMILNK